MPAQQALPPWVGKLIHVFAAQHAHYADEEGARYECGFASDAFLQFLVKKGIRLPDAGLLAAGRTAPYKKYCSSPRSHYIIRIGRVRIDFTARQFHRSFAFPRIWVASRDEEDWLVKIESQFTQFPCWKPT